LVIAGADDAKPAQVAKSFADTCNTPVHAPGAVCASSVAGSIAFENVAVIDVSAGTAAFSLGDTDRICGGATQLPAASQAKGPPAQMVPVASGA
jgi:hypothetical protein